MAVIPQIELDRIQNPTQEVLDKIKSIIDKYTTTSIIDGKPIKHLSKEGPIDKIFKEVRIKGYKKPGILKPLFAMVLAENNIATYDKYRTNKIVFTLQDVLRKNKGDVLSIKPSAVAEILPEFAIEGRKGGKGIPAFRTFLNYLEGSQRLADRSGLQVPTMIAGKPVNQIVEELKQNFLETGEGRARGNFKVFNETKLLDRLANENPEATPNQLKNLYEQNGGASFRERLKNLYLAKSGQVSNKTTGGKSILGAVKTGDITNKLPTSLKKSFAIYGKDFNFGRFSRFASEETDPKKIRYYNDLANRFFTTGAQTRLGTQGLVAEHGLPIAAYDRGYADKSVRAKIDGYVSSAVNNWKAKNFDFPIFRPGGLADQYSNADPADKPGLRKQIEDRLKFTKTRTPDLVKNIKFDFTNGIFTASSSTPEINEKNISKLLSQGKKTMSVFDKTTLFDEIRADAAADGPICSIVKSRKQDGGTVSCVQAVEDAIEKNPQKLAQDASRIDKFKASALGFLKSPGFRSFSAAGAVGAVGTALVKEFRNDDPLSYLSNEDQQKNMLVDMATKPITRDFERPSILDFQLPAMGATLAGATALTAPSTIKASQTNLKFATRAPGVERKKPGVVRTAGRVLGRGLGAAASPALLAPFAAADIAGQVAEGDSLTDIATNPFNYLYPAFADQTPKLTRGLSPTLRKIARLNLGKAALRGVSRGGLLGLGLSLGVEGMKLFDD